MLAVLEQQAAGYTVLTIPAHLKVELEARLGKLGGGALDEGAATASVDRARLRQNLATYFSLEELRTLCFDLGIEHENLPGNKESMARELVTHCERHGRTAELVAICYRLHPHVNW